MATASFAEHRSSANEVLIEKYFELWNGGSPSDAAEIFADDFVRFHPADDVVRDRGSMLAYLFRIRSMFSDFTVTVRVPG